MTIDKENITKKEIFTLSAILFIAIALRIYISSMFYGQSSDEYSNVNLIRNTFASGFKCYPNLFLWFYYFISAVLLFVIDDALIAAKIVTIAFGVASLLVVYFLARYLFNKRIAFLSTFLLLINPEYNLIGSVPLKEPVYTFFILFSLLLLIKKHFFAGAFSIGMAFLTRMEGLLIGMPVYLVCLFKSISGRKDILRIAFVLIIFSLFIFFMEMWVSKPFEYFTGTLQAHILDNRQDYLFNYVSIESTIKRILVTFKKTIGYFFNLIGPNIIFVIPGAYTLLRAKRDQVGSREFFIYFSFHLMFWMAYIFIFGWLIYNFHRYFYILIPFAHILISAGFFKLFEIKRLKHTIMVLFLINAMFGYPIYYLSPGRQYIEISNDNKELIEASKWIEKNIKEDPTNRLLIDGIPCFYLYRKKHNFRIIRWCNSYDKIIALDRESLFDFIDKEKIKYVVWQNDNLPAKKIAPYLEDFNEVKFQNSSLVPLKKFKGYSFRCNIYEYKKNDVWI